jgi:LDH2 family malate/lactate/ureidoglycolate dehydrogenase
LTQKNDDRTYPAATLRDFASHCLQAAGAPPETADTVADNLIDADLRGVTSHGIPRLINVYVERIEAGAVDPLARPTVVRETTATALVEAHNCFGVLAGNLARDLAVRKAKEVGSAWVGVAHSNHFGTCAYYTNHIAAHGMVGITFTNAPPTMAPWGGIKPYLGTNPIALSVPTRGGVPISVDLATSVVARGHLLLAATKGEPIPEGWAQDQRGRPTTDAAEGLAGAVLPVGGHKGYALAFMVDVLSGILTGSGFSRKVGHLYGDLDRPQDVGHLLGAINISCLIPLEDFYDRLDRMVHGVKSSPLAEWADQILVPGEPEATEQARQGEGEIRVAGAIRQQLLQLGARLGVPLE